MLIKICPWNQHKAEAHAFFKVLEICYPLFRKPQPANHMTFLKTHIKDLEDSLCFAKVDGHIVGFAALGKNQAQQANLTCAVLPEFRQQGIGTLLFNYCLDYLKKNNHTILNSFTFQSHSEARDFLTQRSFVEIDRICWTQRKVVDPFPEWVLMKVNTVKNSSIQIIYGHELQHIREDWMEAWWKLQTEVLQDVPSSVPFKEMPFEKFKLYAHPPFTQRENVLFAIKDKELVGSLRLGTLQDGKMNINHTGVARTFRRQGVSTSLKYKAIQLAQQQGAQMITTQNHVHNPMLDLNLKLGFTPRDELIEYIYQIP